MKTDSILAVNEVDFSYSENEAIFTGLSFTLHHTESLALLGQSGIGKTTLCRLLAGLLLPTKGSILFNGSPVTKPSSEITISFQNYPFFPWLSVENNVLFGIKEGNNKNKESYEYAQWLLGKVGLDTVRRRYPRELSGGMQQRLSIARALAVRPKILILDEPFSALDAGTKADLMEMILDLQTKSGFALIAVLHNLEDAYFLMKRSIILRGRPAQICLDLEMKDLDFNDFKNVVIDAMKHPKSEVNSFTRSVEKKEKTFDLNWSKVDL